MKPPHKFNKKIYFVIVPILALLCFAQFGMKMRMSDEKARTSFQSKGIQLQIHDLEYEGNHLHYVQVGNDTLPTLLFIHGSPGSWDAYIQYMQDKDLLARYKMIAIDRPGFGYSDFGHAKKMDKQTEIIGQLINKLKNNKPLSIIGHSLGGPVALQLTAEHPNAVSNLVLLAGSVDPNEEPTEKWRAFFTYFPVRYFVPGALRPSNDELYYFKKDVQKMDQLFPLVTCNVWILHGDKDDLVPVGNAYYAQKKLVNAKSVHLKILSKAPHFIPWEPWYKYVKEILISL